MNYYPPDIRGSQLCFIEGCIGKGNCSRCGEINYALMGFYGAVARWAKVWGIPEEEAEDRIVGHQQAQYEEAARKALEKEKA